MGIPNEEKLVKKARLSVAFSDGKTTLEKKGVCLDREGLAELVIRWVPVSILITDSEERIVFANRAFEEASGYSESEVLGKTPRILSSGRHEADFFSRMWGHIAAEGVWQGEIWDRRKNGEIYPKQLTIRKLENSDCASPYYLGMARDVSIECQQRRQIEFLTYYDGLTGLPNRTLFSDRLSQALARAARKGKRFAVLHLDMDRLRAINDSLGHETGDWLLTEVAIRVRKELRDWDTLCRLGGDEFLVLLEDFSDIDFLPVLAKRIILSVSSPLRLENGKCVSSTVSMGIAIYPDDAQLASELLERAEMAMYQAKEHGRNRYQFFTEDMNHKARYRAELESDLRSALQSGTELFMAYQPKIDLSSGRTVGYEALVRWSPRTGEMIPPDLFIEIAEESHQIFALGDWIIDSVLHHMAQGMVGATADLPVAINISPVQLRQQGFVDRLVAACQRHGVARQRVELEITERVFVGDIDAARALLEQVKVAGFKLTLDDFGTGYSSFNYLLALPFDALKVDRSFIGHLGEHEKTASVLKAIITLAKELGLELVAEGVETMEQAQWLIASGVDIAQGYFYGRPVPSGLR